MDPVTAVVAIAAVVTTATGVAQIVAAKKEEKAAKEAAARQAAIETEKLGITTEKRAIDNSRETARLEREARRKQATIASRALGAGIVGGSIVSEGTQAVSSSKQRELDYLKQTNDLADRADATTAEQIALDAATARQRATSQGLQGVIAGVGSTAKGASSLASSDFSSIGNIFKGESV